MLADLDELSRKTPVKERNRWSDCLIQIKEQGNRKNDMSLFPWDVRQMGIFQSVTEKITSITFLSKLTQT